MSRRINMGGATTALLVLFWSQSTFAQGNCGAIAFSDAISSRFPNARNACLDVVERGGKQLAHFQARVTRVRGNSVEAEFKLPNGKYGRPVTFTPPADARTRIAGQSYRYTDLNRGQVLDVYLPPDRWEIVVPQDATDFATAPTVASVALADVAPQVAAALPSTASFMPLLALLGAVLSGLGACVARVRLRLQRNA